jgi:hypothetical protein
MQTRANGFRTPDEEYNRPRRRLWWCAWTTGLLARRTVGGSILAAAATAAGKEAGRDEGQRVERADAVWYRVFPNGDNNEDRLELDR